MSRIVFRIYLNVLLLCCLCSCATTTNAPVISKESGRSRSPQVTSQSTVTSSASKTKSQLVRDASISHRGYHVVGKGDTLYSIAWRYGFDFRNLAQWNGIPSPYTIYPGQVVRFKPDPNKGKSNLQPGPVVDNSQKPTSRTTTKKVVKAKRQPEPPTIQNSKTKTPVSNKIILPDGPIKWAWPTRGKIVRSNSPLSKKGVDIAGRLGQDVKAAAAGNVVYSGSGLLGYGQLVIIKHNETYLSAYAHNDQILVNEGDVVTAGQLIAKMGKNSQGVTLLHFEIRKNGKPVNPKTYLPNT